MEHSKVFFEPGAAGKFPFLVIDDVDVDGGTVEEAMVASDGNVYVQGYLPITEAERP